MTEEILSVLNGEVFGVWFLIGAALVFWMQAGFAMVETGFTRAKNAGNILMKNLMDFCIGTVVFILIGFSLLLGEDMVGIIGKPGFDIFTYYANFDWSNFVFNLVFCATTATIVSGAMAERTKFISYCVYSGVISAVIYPIEAHWTWGGGFKQLGLQLLGMFATIAWTAVTITIAFIVIKKLFGLRVSEEEEIIGLDAKEHGLPSAYAGFSIMDISNTMTMDVNENTDLGVSDYDKASEFQKDAAVKVVEAPITASASGIYKVVIIAKLSRFEALKTALNDLGVTGMTMTQVMGCGIQKGAGEMYRGAEIDATLLPKVKIEVVVSKIPVDSVIATAKKVLFTGHIGDGKIFVYNVDRVVKVRTGEENTAALQDVE